MMSRIAAGPSKPGKKGEGGRGTPANERAGQGDEGGHARLWAAGPAATADAPPGRNRAGSRRPRRRRSAAKRHAPPPELRLGPSCGACRNEPAGARPAPLGRVAAVAVVAAGTAVPLLLLPPDCCPPPDGGPPEAGTLVPCPRAKAVAGAGCEFTCRASLSANLRTLEDTLGVQPRRLSRHGSAQSMLPAPHSFLPRAARAPGAACGAEWTTL